jgi:uncharacterized damage-inducible protein DinB
MTTMLDDAFAHHVWATVRLIDTCLELPAERLTTSTPGTYGSILDTMRHTVGSDSFYLGVITAGRTPAIDEDRMGLAELRAAIERDGELWTQLLAERTDPDEVVVRMWDDGSTTEAPMGLRLAQAIHHGTDHRSQICTALSELGVIPPEIDLWAWGEATGRVIETPPA